MCVLDDAGLGQLMMLNCVVWFKGKDESSQGLAKKSTSKFSSDIYGL
jgi:hypothetical protein